MMKDKNKLIEERLKGFKPPFSAESADIARSNVFARTIDAENFVRLDKKTSYFGVLYAFAAGLALLIGLPLVIHFVGSTTITSNGETITHILPDGSEINLATNSTLAYNDIFWIFSRTVSLDGEAFFKVSKGEQFDVKTSHGDVSVLGTKFTVWAKERSLVVYCMEGSVNVEGSIIQGNDYIILDRDSKKLGKWESPEVFISANKESLSFDNTPLEIVSELLETHFEKDIIIQADGIFSFSGSLDPDNLENSLEILTKPFGLEIAIEGSRVVILEP